MCLEGFNHFFNFIFKKLYLSVYKDQNQTLLYYLKKTSYGY